MTNPVTFTLPMPPSMNRLWRANRGRVHVSQDYKAWKMEASLRLNQQKHVGEIHPPYRVVYAFDRRDERVGDVFNREKALSDLLQSQGVIKDDKYIEDGRVYWDRENKLAPPGMVHCTVESLK